MLSKMNGINVELVPKIPNLNQRVCEYCDGIGWMYDKENKFIEKCRKCYDGLINLCPVCGNDTRGYCNNVYCEHERESEKEDRLFYKANKITLAQAKEMGITMLYHESYDYDNGYFDISDIDDFVDSCIDDNVEVPKYVWGTSKTNMVMDAYSIVENACDELYEDAVERVREKDIDELQDYLDKWCEKQSETDTYWQDTNYLIQLWEG